MTRLHPRAFDDAPASSDDMPYPLLMAELTHRTANDFATACAAVHLAKRSTNDAAMHATLDALGSRLDAIARLHRVLQVPTTPVLDFGQALRDLCWRMAQARFAPRGISLHLDVDDVSLEAQAAWGVLMIVAELLINVDRHAYPEDGAGQVTVMAFERNATVFCQVMDGGRGRPPENSARGCGSTIVRSIADVIGAAVTYPSRDSGTLVEVSLAKPFFPSTAVDTRSRRL